MVEEGDGGKAEGVCDVRRTDVSPRTINKNGVKRSVGGRVVCAKVLHTTGKGLDGANVGMARRAMTDRFPPNGVFLVGEDELDKRGGVKLGKRRSEGAELAGTGAEQDIAKAKRGTAVLFGRECIFARATQIVESNSCQVGNGKVKSDISLASDVTNVMDKRNGDGLDAGVSGFFMRARHVFCEEFPESS